MVRASYPIADQLEAAVDKQADAAFKMDAESIVKEQLEGVAIGIKKFRDVLAKSIKKIQPSLR